jgi:hypothetical protein
LTLPRPLTAQQLRATHEDVRCQIDELLDEYTDAQVARVLNERGLTDRRWRCLRRGQRAVVRFSTKLASLKERLLAAGMLTSMQMTNCSPEPERGRAIVTLATQPYLEQVGRWPSSGRRILAHFDDASVVV